MPADLFSYLSAPTYIVAILKPTSTPTPPANGGLLRETALHHPICYGFIELSEHNRESTTSCVSIRQEYALILGDSTMPTISMFYGILIQMYWDEHAPPYFHAIYGEFKATVDIRSLQIAEGNLPRRAIQLVLDWAELHQAELLLDWDLCQVKQMPKPIDPLK